MSIEIPLSQGRISLIDEADWELVRGYRWYAVKDRNVWYAQANTSRKEGPRRTVRMHRLLLGLTDGKIKIDHRDGDGLNNQRANLRSCKHAQNLRNTGAHANNTSGFKGVSWDKQSGRWKAQIRGDLKKKHIGYFFTPEEAFAAYCSAAAELHGEFANVG